MGCSYPGLDAVAHPSSLARHANQRAVALECCKPMASRATLEGLHNYLVQNSVKKIEIAHQHT